MTAEEIRGRRITIMIALVVGVPPLIMLLILLALGKPGSQIPWFQILLPMVLSILLFKGYRWARAYIIFSLCAGALLLLVQPLLAGSLVLAIATAIFSLPFAAIYVTSAVVLYRSKAVEAYFEKQTHDRDSLPSLKDQDDA